MTNYPKPQASTTQNLLNNPAEDPELSQRLMNESKIHDLDKQLFTSKMELYYLWMAIYGLFLITQSRTYLEPYDLKANNKSLVVTYSVYAKNIADGLTFLGCIIVFGAVKRRSVQTMNFIIWCFKIHIVVTLAFYAITTIFAAKGFLLLGVVFGGIAYLNLFPLWHIKKILVKREAIYPYSTLVDDPIL